MQTRLLFLLALSIILSNCTVPVNIKPKVKTSQFDKIPMEIGLNVKDSEITHRASGLFFVGSANTFVINVGQALDMSAQSSFKALFDDVIVIENIEDRSELEPKYTVVLVPYFSEYYVSQTMSSGMHLRLEVLDSSKQRLYKDDVTVVGSAGPLVASTSTFGFSSAAVAIEASSSEAFEKAFHHLLSNLFQNFKFEQI
ncbi:MAG: hypothetical protein OCC49_03630 [Fibrobacterales bacterium]